MGDRSTTNHQVTSKRREGTQKHTKQNDRGAQVVLTTFIDMPKAQEGEPANVRIPNVHLIDLIGESMSIEGTGQVLYPKKNISQENILDSGQLKTILRIVLDSQGIMKGQHVEDSY